MKISTFFAVLVAQTLGKATFFVISTNYLIFKDFYPALLMIQHWTTHFKFLVSKIHILEY